MAAITTAAALAFSGTATAAIAVPEPTFTSATAATATPSVGSSATAEFIVRNSQGMTAQYAVTAVREASGLNTLPAMPTETPSSTEQPTEMEQPTETEQPPVRPTTLPTAPAVPTAAPAPAPGSVDGLIASLRITPGFSVGATFVGSPVFATGGGLLPASPVTLTLHSTPVVLASETVAADGTVGEISTTEPIDAAAEPEGALASTGAAPAAIAVLAMALLGLGALMARRSRIAD